jgi:hypothetical protein
MLEKTIKDINLGNQTITIKRDKKGHVTASLRNMWSSTVELRMKETNLQIRIPSGNLTWANVSLEHLVIMLNEIGCIEDVKKLLNG